MNKNLEWSTNQSSVPILENYEKIPLNLLLGIKYPSKDESKDFQMVFVENYVHMNLVKDFLDDDKMYSLFKDFVNSSKNQNKMKKTYERRLKGCVEK